jgi:hypothetical protein
MTSPAPADDAPIGALLTIDDVMALTKLGKSTIKTATREGLLESRYFNGTLLRYRREWVDAWIDSWPSEPAA